MDAQYIKYIQALEDDEVQELVRKNILYFRTEVWKIGAKTLGKCIGRTPPGIYYLEKGRHRVPIDYLFSLYVVTGTPVEEFFKDHSLENPSV